MQRRRVKAERLLYTISVLGLVLLTLTVIALGVAALRGWFEILVLTASIGVVLLAARFLRRRVPKGTVLEIDLEGGVVETAGTDPVSRAMHRNAVTVRDFVDALQRGAGDDRITGLIVRLGNAGIGVAHAQELRDAVHSFRSAGKRAIAFAEVLGESGPALVDYSLAASFDEIYLQPGAIASIEGLVARSPFLRGLFEMVGIVPDFEHREEYKSAKYLFTEIEFTEPHREVQESVAKELFSQIIDGIAADRGLHSDTVKTLVDSAPLTAEEARTARLIDHLGHRDRAYQAAGKKFMFHDRYLRRVGRPHRKGPKIALIYGTGSIARGSSRFDPLSGGSSLGADEVARTFREAIDDDRVEGIVFRVDSPGGSAVASEVVGHEVVRAVEAGKPVVVSMAGVAGSGGYWISAPATRIVAQPGTITGSIGVVWGKLADRAAWARIGITFDQVTLGRNATFSSNRDLYTDSERRRLEVMIDDVYDTFVDHVATNRELSPEHAREIAKGRIWTGAQALENGLVDELGGLEQAISTVKGEVGVAPEDEVAIVVYPRERALPLRRRKDSSEPVEVAAALIADLFTGVSESVSGAQARVWLPRP
ncbi:MAG TPA: signal peptide peptidase SppA [Acidimicrobiia bacterium]|nr:signal peptide peptidase SppA [Acidimicrobiia bacterium]